MRRVVVAWVVAVAILVGAGGVAVLVLNATVFGLHAASRYPDEHAAQMRSLEATPWCVDGSMAGRAMEFATAG